MKPLGRKHLLSQLEFYADNMKRPHKFISGFDMVGYEDSFQITEFIEDLYNFKN